MWGLDRAGTRKIQVQILIQQANQSRTRSFQSAKLDVDVDMEIEEKSSQVVEVSCWLGNSRSWKSTVLRMPKLRNLYFLTRVLEKM